MAEEDHPFITKTKRYMPLPLEGDDGIAQMAHNIALWDDPSRVQILDDLDRHLEEDDCSLRQKAQLISLRRRCTDVHKLLRTTGR